MLNDGFPRSTRFLYSIGDLSHIEPNKNHQTSIHKTKQKLTLERICWCFVVVDRSYTCMKWHSYDNTSFHSDAAHCSSVIRLLVVVDVSTKQSRSRVYISTPTRAQSSPKLFKRQRSTKFFNTCKLSVIDIAGKMHSLLSR